jgi:hypothetical protein
MSLGNESNDAEYERAGVLNEAAVQMVVHGKSRESAIKEAEHLYSQRTEAERRDEVERDEHGNAIAYLNASLNPSELTPEHREAAASKYADLCEDEGLDAV